MDIAINSSMHGPFATIHHTFTEEEQRRFLNAMLFSIGVAGVVDMIGRDDVRSCVSPPEPTLPAWDTLPETELVRLQHFLIGRLGVDRVRAMLPGPGRFIVYREGVPMNMFTYDTYDHALRLAKDAAAAGCDVIVGQQVARVRRKELEVQPQYEIVVQKF